MNRFIPLPTLLRLIEQAAAKGDLPEVIDAISQTNPSSRITKLLAQIENPKPNYHRESQDSVVPKSYRPHQVEKGPYSRKSR